MFDGSTCQDQLKALPVSGKTYNFIFTVTADNTPVSISLTGLCGVDLDNNMVALQGNGVTVTPLAIPANTASMPFQSTSLNKGTYTISVTSAKNTDNPHFKMGDFDDFIISQVQLQGSNLQGVSFNVQP